MAVTVNFETAPVSHDIHVLQGDTYLEACQILRSSKPLNLEGAKIKVCVRRRPTSGETVVEHELALDDPHAGRFTLEVPAEHTAQLLGSYYYTVTIEWPAGSKSFPRGCRKTVLFGEFAVTDEIYPTSFPPAEKQHCISPAPEHDPPVPVARYYRDGDAWCVVTRGFIDLQQTPDDVWWCDSEQEASRLTDFINRAVAAVLDSIGMEPGRRAETR